MIVTDRKSILRKISKILKKLGISPGKEGYFYLRDSIYLCVITEEKIKITKSIYPVIANKYNKTISSIEKAMRKAIEIGWNNCDLSYSEDLFENTINYNKGKPTNLEFIATISEDIILNL